MKVHEIIISLASNDNQEANLAKAREQLTQLMTEVHFTSAIWTEPIATSRKEPYLNQLCKGTTTFGEGLLCEVLKETEKRIGRIKNWSRNYVKDLLNEL